MNTKTLDGALFADMVRGGAANLYSNRTIVNDLNVFPIPDGDTGDNMYMTISSGAFSLGDARDETLGGIASAVAHGMLLGARGNSGVILSRIFAGIAEGFSGREKADIEAVGVAFSEGIKQAYSAVSVPVEGTILTVYKDAVRYAERQITGGGTLNEYFEDFAAELRRSLQRTPELLDVLREAGVVDSGGAGFVYIAEGMKSVLNGEAVATPEITPERTKTVDTSSFTADSVMEYGYCTEFLLQLQNKKTDIAHFDMEAFTSYLNSVGESVVAFLDGSIIKVHVHTMAPGVVLNHCQQYGEFLTLKIENMLLQHHESTVRDRFTPPQKKPHKAYGTVAVAAGDGIKQTFASLGADVIVEGGQSMNPSSHDFLNAFAEINADTILVFPNNGNVILTAKQAAELYGEADVRIVPTHTIGEGYAALSMLDTSMGDTDAILAELNDAISGVLTGAVSRAVRDTERDGVSVHAGDYLGFVGDTIYTDMPDRTAALRALCEKLGAGKYDVMILVCGKDTDKAETEALYEALQAAYKRTEVILIDGGQPVYDYILILE